MSGDLNFDMVFEKLLNKEPPIVYPE